MLLGVYDAGTEDMICHPLVANQMGAVMAPLFFSVKTGGVKGDPTTD